MIATRFLPFRRIALSALALVLSTATWASAQCESCNNGKCQGRCMYCVDGVCIPKSTTYGFYQTHWRRWPIDAPPVPQRPRSGRRALDDVLGPDEIDLPAPEDETDVRPEFSRLRKTGNPNSDVINDPARKSNGAEKPDPDGILLPGLEAPERELPSMPLDTGATHTRPRRTSPPVVPASAATARHPNNPLRETIDSPAGRVASHVVRPTSHLRPRAPKKLRPGSGNPLR